MSALKLLMVRGQPARARWKFTHRHRIFSGGTWEREAAVAKGGRCLQELRQVLAGLQHAYELGMLGDGHRRHQPSLHPVTTRAHQCS